MVGWIDRQINRKVFRIYELEHCAPGGIHAVK